MNYKTQQLRKIEPFNSHSPETVKPIFGITKLKQNSEVGTTVILKTKETQKRKPIKCKKKTTFLK